MSLAEAVFLKAFWKGRLALLARELSKDLKGWDTAAPNTARLPGNGVRCLS